MTFTTADYVCVALGVLFVVSMLLLIMLWVPR
jgi:hypothetical protein